VRISSVRKGASGATIVADGGSSFIIDLGLLEELGLPESAVAPGSELDDQAAAILALAAEAREAEARGLALLARAEQSTRMLRLKLAARGFGEAAVRLAVGRLETAGLAADGRFARAYVASRLSRRGSREGPATLAAALRGRGVDAETAAAAVAAVLGPDERRNALAAAAAEALARCGGDRGAARARLRYLGYGGGEISEYFAGIDETESD
jgi:regulatory protein